MILSATVIRNRLLTKVRLRHLLLFQKVLELGSLRLAAQAIGMTQPSATEALAELERLLGCSLFLRHTKGMAPTDNALVLAPMVNRMLALVDDSATVLSAMDDRSRSMVSMASISAAIPGLLGDALSVFCQKHPHITIQLQEADARRQSSLIAAHEIDVAVCRQPEFPPEGWTFLPWMPDRLVIVSSSRHPLARRTVISHQDLLNCVWMVSPTGVIARQAFDQLFESSAKPPKMHSIVSSAASVVLHQLLRENLLAIVPKSLVSKQLAQGELLELPLASPISVSDIGLLVPAVDHSPALHTLVHFLQSSYMHHA